MFIRSLFIYLFTISLAALPVAIIKRRRMIR
jgi:hypothetical protein